MLILASRSPQRRALLDQVGIPYSASPTDVEEVSEGEPSAVALHNARAKALAAAAEAAPEDLVLGVDTLVSGAGAIYGKAANEQAARATLVALSGISHEVISALVTVRAGELRTASSVTVVSFRDLEKATLDWYLTTGEWRERAGAYAIQGAGAALVRAIEGDYTNVVGLPLATLLALHPELLPRGV